MSKKAWWTCVSAAVVVALTALAAGAQERRPAPEEELAKGDSGRVILNWETFRNLTEQERGPAEEPRIVLPWAEVEDLLGIKVENAEGAELTLDWKQFKALYDGVLADTVTEMHDRLAGRDRHFGYRVAAEIARFVLLAASQAGESAGSLWSALDVALKAKVLAKLHGTRQELEGLLRDLLEVAENVEQLPLTADKVQRMLRRAERQGFTSFIE